MPRYVILRHQGSSTYKPGVHWDLLLEHGNVLRSWALSEIPTVGISIDAESLPDHRLLYLDFEGPLSGDRGTVTAWDRGEYRLLHEAADEFQIHLAGEKLRGRVNLFRAATGDQRWRFFWEPD
jgi:hypothetical protein